MSNRFYIGYLSFTALFLATCLAVISACAPVTPKTPDNVVRSAYGAYIGIVDTTASMLEADVITVDQAKVVQAAAKPLRADLEKARALVASGKPIARDLLTRVQTSHSILLRL